MSKVYILTALFFIAYSSFAQISPGRYNIENMPKEGIIKGKVQEVVSNQFVEYSTIGLFSHRDSTLITGTISDQNGDFILNELPYGFFYIEVSFIGYKKVRLSRIRITPNSKIVDLGIIKLEPSYTSLEEVQVTADKPLIEYKIDRKVITVSEDISSSGGTAVDALENTPSIQTDIEGNVTLRGSSNFKVLVDNKPSVLDGSDALQQIPASTIQSIEIITNPSAKYDPDGMAGIINVIMKKQKQSGFGGIFNVSVGLREKYRIDFLLNVRKNNINIYGGINYDNRKFSGTGIMDRESYYQDTVYYVLSDGERDFRRRGIEYKGGIDYYINEKHTISLSGNAGDRDFSRSRTSQYHEYTNPQSVDQWYNSKDEFSVDFNYYGLNLDYLIKFNEPGHELLSSIYYRSRQGINKDNMEEDTASVIETGTLRQRSTQDEQSTELRFKTDYTRQLSDNGKFEAGYQSRLDFKNADFIFEDYDYDQNEWLGNDEFTNEIEVYRNIQNIYGLFSNKFAGFDYQLGLRMEYTDRTINQITTDEKYTFNRLMLFSTLHLSRQFKNDQQLLLSYSRRIRRPRHWFLNPFARYIDRLNMRVGNPDLEPELTDSYELNYQKQFGKSFIAIETYYRQTNDKITRIRMQDTTGSENVLIHTIDNVSRDYSVGVELMANLQLFKWWNLNTSTNFFNYRIEGEIVNEDVSQMKNTWNVRMNSTFKFEWGSRIQLTGFYAGPSVTAQGERDAFYHMNAAVRQDFMNRKASLTLQVRDIFQTRKFSFTTTAENLYTYNKFTREAPVVMLTFTYRLNNIKQPKREEEVIEMDYDNGM
jgi:outer membrane cobalamin receptor